MFIKLGSLYRSNKYIITQLRPNFGDVRLTRVISVSKYVGKWLGQQKALSEKYKTNRTAITRVASWKPLSSENQIGEMGDRVKGKLRRNGRDTRLQKSSIHTSNHVDRVYKLALWWPSC